jgi:hypothetical protein
MKINFKFLLLLYLACSYISFVKVSTLNLLTILDIILRNINKIYSLKLIYNKIVLERQSYKLKINI